jgi:WD40 repeat protein
MKSHLNDETTVGAASRTYFGDSQSAHLAEDRVPAEWNIGDIILDLYEVRQVYEGGGMGVVYRVHHRGWNIDLAVKSPRANYFHTEEQKKNFVRECETWINLGLHPHIVACHYVRALGEIPRVFAEYIECGSLKDWIDSRKLYEGGRQEALKRILDIAIQMAWGLRFAHEQGLIHQDVKPANVLMTSDGTAKITDFGLAKARTAADEKGDGNTLKSFLATSGGMTPAYCSPEQANKQPLSRRTDIWSWALSVLEMIAGEAFWQSGVAAPEILQQLNDPSSANSRMLDFPPGMFELLSQCFALDPSSRPISCEVVADVVRNLYHQSIGAEFPRSSPRLTDLRADALNNRAISLLDLGHLSEAEKGLADTLVIDPLHAEANANYHLLLWRSARITDAAAIRTLSNLLQNANASHATPATGKGNPRLGLALIHAERGDLATAIEHLESARRETGRSDDLMTLLTRYRKCQIAIPEIRSIKCTGHEIHSISPSPDGRFVAVGSDPHDGSGRDDCLTIWDTDTGETVARFDTCELEFDFMRKPQASCVAWVPGHRRVMTGGLTGSLLLWDLDRGGVVKQFLTHDHMVTALRISEDGRYAVSGSADKTVKLWEIDSDVEAIEMRQSMSEILGRGFSAIVSENKEGVPSKRTFRGNNQWVDSVAVSTALGLVVSGGEDNSVRVWDLETGETRGVWLGHEGRVKSIIVIESLGLIASGSFDTTIRLWNISTGEHQRTLRGHTSIVKALAYSNSGDWLLSAGSDGTVCIWDIGSGRCLRTLENLQMPIEDLALREGGDCCIFADRAGVLRMWEPALGPTANFVLARPRSLVSLSEKQLRVQSLTQQADSAAATRQFALAIQLIDEARAAPVELASQLRTALTAVVH